jgi:hypothetical protein
MAACPSCFQDISPDHYFWVCQSGKCEQGVDEVASAFLNGSVESGPTYALSKPAGAPRSWAPHPVRCAACQELCSDGCPNCHFPLPPLWRTFDVTTVAMSGAIATGKSVYIAVMIKQLTLMLTQLKSALGFFDTRTRDTYVEKYETPLFVTLGIIGSTPRSDTGSHQRYPMIFDLGQIKGVRRILVVRDVAGEEMEETGENITHLSFLTHADGILFMFDPLAVPAIKDYLRDVVPLQDHGRDPRLVLDNLRRIIGNAQPKIGVVLSKFDALQALRDVDSVEWKRTMSNPGAAIMRDPSLSAKYDRADGDLLSLEVQSLLDKLGAGDFMTRLESTPNGLELDRRFFAVSVLGESPDGASISKLGISPFRILDPIKWLLHTKGIL